MKRGDVYTVSTQGPAAKPRPAIVLTADEFIRPDRPVILCPLTSELTTASLLRIRIEPDDSNEPRTASEAMLERMGAAFPREIGRPIGQLDKEDLERIEVGLINLLGLGQMAAILSGPGTQS